MTLHKIKDFNPEYKKHFNNHEIKGVGLYSGNEKIGTIDDVLVTDEGKFRYFVIDTGGWILGKKTGSTELAMQNRIAKP
jgi:PRC-barrel domain